MSRFIQIHFLTSYSASLLNRDDVGLAKRLPFGGSTRTRISSQCMKRHWRIAEDAYALADLEGVDMSVRSRRTFEECIIKPLLQEGKDEDITRKVVTIFQEALLGKSSKASKKEADKGASLNTDQLVVLGYPEVRFLSGEVRQCLEADAPPLSVAKERVQKEFKKNFEAMRKGAQASEGLDAALFGRMVTSDILSRVDAAAYVAHPFTVHAEESEPDYFSAVDDLDRVEGVLGSGHINETELTTGLFYGYVVLDLPQLVSNLEGVERKEWLAADRTLAARVTESLIHLIATVSPGAKRGSTAPFAYADFVLLEAGNRQPRSLANAFFKPVSKSGDLRGNALQALTTYITQLDGMYGMGEERRYASLTPVEALAAEQLSGLPALAQWAAASVQGASK